MIGRRGLLLSLPLSFAQAAPRPIRIGTLRFGAVAWELDVIRAHKLAAGIEPVVYAASQATQVALQAGDVDVIVQDWLWVSRQRGAGADWSFVPSSAAIGAVMVPADSGIHGVADLPGRRLGIAGTPLDKSWLLLRAYAKSRHGIDLDAQVEKTFGPPPLLAEQLAAGRLDAALTYWPFAARAEAEGLKPLLGMHEAIAGLGAPPLLPMIGWVFSSSWAQSRPDVRNFLEAARQARAILVESNAEWDRIAPLTGARNPDELAQLQAWYRRGAGFSWGKPEQDAAARLYDLLAAVGGPALVGSAVHLSPGTFWGGIDSG